MSTDEYLPPGTSANTVAIRSASRAMPNTEAPRSAKSCAVAAPSPADAPVINATLPSSCVMARPSHGRLPGHDGARGRSGGTAANSARVYSCSRCGEQLRSGPVLDRFAVAHDQHVVAHLLDDGQVVGDEQIRQPHVALQLREQIEHMRLHRNIQRRSRFVEDQQLGLAGQGPRDAHPLALAAGQLVWVSGGERRWQADEFE